MVTIGNIRRGAGKRRVQRRDPAVDPDQKQARQSLRLPGAFMAWLRGDATTGADIRQ
jgi:hypothetical protein